MKLRNFLIFFSVVLIIHSSLNYYIIQRGLEALPVNSVWRIYFVVSVVFFASAFIIGRLLERISINFFSSLLIWTGAFWLGIMVYLFLMILTVDILRGINNFAEIFPPLSHEGKLILFAAIGLTAIIISAASYVNIRFAVVRNFNLSIDKKAGKLKSLKIVMVSDIHLGTIIGREYLNRIIEIINSLNPDIILIPGDIIDEDIEPVLSDNMGETLQLLRAKYGVFAVTGNHEYIGGVDKAKDFLSNHGITLLNDEIVLIDGSFYVAGREDLSMNQFTSKKRKPLKLIVGEADKNLPIILLDHQPFGLNQAVENGVDLQLSGHTHNGQLFPFNYMTKAVFELSYGYKRKGDTHFYVSCGVGGWGPPIRTNSRPEIICFDISFG